MLEKILKILILLREIMSGLIKLVLKQLNGTRAKKAGCGIVKIPEIRSELERSSFVEIVARALNQLCQTLCFVVINAEINTGVSINESTILLNANNAGKRSQRQKSKNIDHPGGFVAMGAQTPFVKKVYNITVEKDGCFYANSILVSNCDALTGTIEQRGKAESKDLSGIFY